MDPPVATWWIALTRRSRPSHRVDEEEEGVWEDCDESVEEAAVMVDDGGEEGEEEEKGGECGGGVAEVEVGGGF